MIVMQVDDITNLAQIERMSCMVRAAFANRCGITRRKFESVLAGRESEFFTRKILKRAWRRIRCPVRINWWSHSVVNIPGWESGNERLEQHQWR